MNKRRTTTERAGVTFPPARFRRALKKGKYAERISMNAAVYLAAVEEYLVSELMELAGEVAHRSGKSRIIPRHINLAIQNDSEMQQFLDNVVLYHT